MKEIDEFDLENIKFEKGQIIKNLIASDLNKDGYMDMLITYSDKDKKNNFLTDVFLGYKQNFVEIKSHFKRSRILEGNEFIFGDFNGYRMY